MRAWLRQHYPGVPVRFLPLRNPAVRIEWTHGGGGEYLAVVLDEEGRIMEEHWGAKAEVLAWMARRWPGLPVEFVPMVKEQNPALAARLFWAQRRKRYGPTGRPAATPF